MRCARGRAGRSHAFLEHAHDVDHVARLRLVLGESLFDVDDVAFSARLRLASASNASV
jgi:hypothetical protein